MPERSDLKTRRYYDELSASYDARRQHRYHRMVDDLEVEIALPYARGGRVLELGCGTGTILSRIATVAREAIGIDLSPHMADHARARGLDVRVGSICDLPFEDEHFDLTYSFKVLPHVVDIEAAIREAARVTRLGGHLLLELYNPWSLRYLAKAIAGPGRVTEHCTEADVYTRWDAPPAIRRLLPPSLELVDYRGVRVLTPMAAVHGVSWLSGPLRRAERWATRSPLRRFGGFLVAVLRKRAHA